MANSAEAQAWVSIGTNLPVKTKGVEKENIEEVVFKQEKDDDAGSEKQLHLDEDALQLEPFASDDFVTGDKFEQDEAQQNGHDTKEEPTSVENEKDKERDGESNSAKPKDEEEDVGHQTNSNNPQLVRCRIFVGHLNTDKCSRKDVEDLFAPFGKVLACSLQQGYGFVQYETEQSARKAIKELHGVSFFGMKLVVDKTAAQKKSDGEDPRARKPWPGEKGRSYDDRGEPRGRRRRQDDRQESSDYNYRQERYSSSQRGGDPYYAHYREPYDRTYERRYERSSYEPQSYDRGTYERSLYERGGYDRSSYGGYDHSSYERGGYERYPTEKAPLDRYNPYPTSPPSSKPAVHDRDYFAVRDPYRTPADRRWEERPLYDQYAADYYARPRGADYAGREEAYYSAAARDDPYDPPRHDPYERRPYDRYATSAAAAAATTYDRRY